MQAELFLFLCILWNCCWCDLWKSTHFCILSTPEPSFCRRYRGHSIEPLWFVFLLITSFIIFAKTCRPCRFNLFMPSSCMASCLVFLVFYHVNHCLLALTSIWIRTSTASFVLVFVSCEFCGLLRRSHTAILTFNMLQFGMCWKPHLPLTLNYGIRCVTSYTSLGLFFFPPHCDQRISKEHTHVGLAKMSALSCQFFFFF